jgi:DNA-binding ferritin-like protein (Dps family)
MAARWIEALTGAIEQKKQYREYRDRIAALPDHYREPALAVERYLLYTACVSEGDAVVRMLDDSATLWERAAADRTPIREVVGEDPVAFAEAFVGSYDTRQWADRERSRLAAAIDAAEAGASA